MDGRFDPALGQACIEEFGLERSLFGSNWPVDRLYSSYTDVVAAYRELVSEFTRPNNTLY